MKAKIKVSFEIEVDTDSEEFANLKEFRAEMRANKDEFAQRLDEIALTEIYSQHAGFAIDNDVQVVNVKYGNVMIGK